jgi:hypothetical protein
MKYDYVTNLNPGLGDCLSVFTTSLPCYSPSPHFKTLRKYSNIPTFRGEGMALRTELLHGKHPGEHLFNKARIEAGDEVLDNPRPLLDKVIYTPRKGIISFSFDVGGVVAQQRATIHPRARMLYPEHREMFQRFILDNPELTFFEIGQRSFNFAGVSTVAVGRGLEATIEQLANSSAYIGITSGLQHLACAIGVPTCSIINIPAPEDFGDAKQQEMDWLEPQCYYLHSDGESCRVNKLNRTNLEGFIANL